MFSHGLGCGSLITRRDCLDDALMLIAVRGLERRCSKTTIAAIPTTLPSPVAAHARQSVHHRDKSGIARDLTKRLMERAVRLFTISKACRSPTTSDKLLQIIDIRRISTSRSLGRNHRLQQQAGAQQISRSNISPFNWSGRKVSRSLPYKGALTHMAPDQTFPLQNIETCPHRLPAAIEATGQITLGRQAIARRQSIRQFS